MNKAVSSGTNHLINPTKCELSEWLQMLLIRTLKPTTTTTTTKSLFVHKETERWASEGGVFGGGIWQKNSKGCLQIPAAWRREGKRFCPCVPSLKFPGGTEITKYKQEREWAENRGKCSERGGVTKRWKVKKFIQSHTLVKLSDTCVCVCVLLHTQRCSHDFPELSLYLPVSCLHQTFRSLLHPPAPKSLSLSAMLFLPAWMKLSLYQNLLLSLSLSARKQSELDSLKPSVVRGWIVSLPCPIPFDPRWKNRLPVCSWLVVTPLDFWVCMEGGQEVENFSPPFPPLHACLHTLPPSSSSHWPLSIVPAGPQRALSANQSGFQWGRRSWVAFYGVERGGGGSWWSWSWGGALWPLCHGMCVHSHHLLATNTHAQRHADRHTHRKWAAMDISSVHLWHSFSISLKTQILVFKLQASY